MKIKLPKNATGEEILAVLKEAVGAGWIAREIGHESRYEPGSVKLVLVSNGLEFRPTTERKKYFLFGPTITTDNSSFSCTLRPVNLNKHYDEIDILFNGNGVGYRNFKDTEKICMWNKRDGTDFRRKFEKLLGKFFDALQSKAA